MYGKSETKYFLRFRLFLVESYRALMRKIYLAKIEVHRVKSLSSIYNANPGAPDLCSE